MPYIAVALIYLTVVVVLTHFVKKLEDCDAYQAFVETGNIFDPEMAASFRANILERVGAEDPMTLYLRFRGAKPGTDALLANRGLN